MKFLTPLICTEHFWTPISNDPDAVQVGSTSTFSELADLDFKFHWLGGGSYTDRVAVTSNDQINININDLDSNCCTVDGIGDYNEPRIAVVQEDLYGGLGAD